MNIHSASIVVEDEFVKIKPEKGDAREEKGDGFIFL